MPRGYIHYMSGLDDALGNEEIMPERNPRCKHTGARGDSHAAVIGTAPKLFARLTLSLHLATTSRAFVLQHASAARSLAESKCDNTDSKDCTHKPLNQQRISGGVHFAAEAAHTCCAVMRMPNFATTTR